MASRTLITYGLLVDIKMAGSTISFGLIEFKGGVALPAINHLMLAFQFKPGSIVLKRNRVFGNGPTVSGVTSVTADFQLFTCLLYTSSWCCYSYPGDNPHRCLVCYCNYRCDKEHNHWRWRHELPEAHSNHHDWAWMPASRLTPYDTSHNLLKTEVSYVTDWWFDCNQPGDNLRRCSVCCYSHHCGRLHIGRR